MGRVTTGLCLTVLALLALSSPVFAHHGTAGAYDEHTVAIVEGTVQQFFWRNPHSTLIVIGKDASGNQTTYYLQMGAPKALVDRGFSRTTFKPGDVVKVRMHPALEHPTNGDMLEEAMVINGKKIIELGCIPRPNDPCE